jgi:hypothetical protein
MEATAKRNQEIIDTVQESETDVRRKARLRVDHRRALTALAAVTLRYQVHNEFAQARQASVDAELRESEARIRARVRRITGGE